MNKHISFIKSGLEGLNEPDEKINTVKLDIKEFDSEIKFYNPQDYPFGILSNHYPQEMSIEGKKWRTVTNYVYASMLKSDVDKTVLQFAKIGLDKIDVENKIYHTLLNMEKKGKILSEEEKEKIAKSIREEVRLENMDIRELFAHYLDEETARTLKKGFLDGFNEKISKNQKMRDTLLSTENRPIIYSSENKYLGVNSQGEGRNILGNTLMQIRYNLLLQKKSEERQTEILNFEEKILTIYRAIYILRQEISEKNDLTEYINLDAKKIISDYLSKTSKTLTDLNLDDSKIKITVLEMYKRGQLPLVSLELNEPGNLAKNIQEKNELTFKIDLQDEIDNIILTSFVEFTLSEKYPEKSKAEIRELASYFYLSCPTKEDCEKLKEGIKKEFINKNLDKRLTRKIEKKIRNIENMDSYRRLKSIDSEDEKYSDEKEVDSVEEFFQEDTLIISKIEKHSGKPIIDVLKNILSKIIKEKKRLLTLVDNNRDEYKNHSILYIKNKLGLFSETYHETKTEDLSIYDLNDDSVKIVKKIEKQSGTKIDFGLILEDVLNEKVALIQTLQKYTGKKAKIFKNLSITELKTEIERYDSDHADLKISSGLGEWVLTFKTKTNIKVVLETLKGLKPKKGEIEHILKDYNEKNNTDIEMKQVFLYWKNNFKPQSVEEIRRAIKEPYKFDLKISEEYDFVSSVGEPVYISYDIQNNTPELAVFSPLYQDYFIINGEEFPSLSFYTLVCLLTDTGITSYDEKGEIVTKKGMSFKKAVELLKNKNNFVSLEKGYKIYFEYKEETFKTLMIQKLKKALNYKFNILTCGQVLILTGKSSLIWNDKKDSFLGTGEDGKGENLCGQMLEEIRKDISGTHIKNLKYFRNYFNGNLQKLIAYDTIVFDWASRNVKQTCLLTKQFVQYLNIIGKQKGSIDKEFIKNVILLFFSETSSEVSLEEKTENIPDTFKEILKTEKCLNIQVRDEYTEKIKEKEKEIDIFNSTFWGDKMIEEEEKDKEKRTLTPEKIVSLLEKFKERNKEATDEEIKDYYDKLTKKYTQEEKEQTESFHETLRKDYENYFKKINSPVLSDEKILEEKRKIIKNFMKKIREKYGEEGLEKFKQLASLVQNEEDETKDEIEEKTKKGKQKGIEKDFKKLKNILQNKLDSLVKRKYDPVEIAEKLKKFSEKQERKIKQYYGSSYKERTEEEKRDYEIRLKEMNSQLRELNNSKKKYVESLSVRLTGVSNIYWNFVKDLLISMVSKENKKFNEMELRSEIFYKIRKDYNESTCLKLVNKDYDCIISALLNILEKIEKFKTIYAHKIVFGKYDIDLAKRVLLGLKVEDNVLAKEFKGKVKFSEEENLEEEKQGGYEYIDFKDDDDEVLNLIDITDDGNDIERQIDPDRAYYEDSDNFDDLAKEFKGKVKFSEEENLEEKQRGYEHIDFKHEEILDIVDPTYDEDDIERQAYYEDSDNFDDFADEEAEMNFTKGSEKLSISELEKVRKHLSNFSDSISDDLVEYFIETVNIIYNYKITENDKNLRINMFSSKIN